MKCLYGVILVFLFAACTDYVQRMDDGFDDWTAEQNSEDGEKNGNIDSQKDSNTITHRNRIFKTGASGTVRCNSDPTKTCAQFDLVVRDFQANHPDFENFTEEASVNLNATWVYPGYQDDPNWVAKRGNAVWGCANADPENGRDNSALGIFIGTDGYPIAMNPGIQSQLPDYLQTKLSATGQKTMYGEFMCSGKKMRGYEHEMLSKGCTKQWSQPVLVTPGLAYKYLEFDPILGEGMMYEPVILKARDACDNQYFSQWFADRDESGTLLQSASINARMNSVLQLSQVAGTKNTFEIDYNWNNGGYFPLDVVDANNNWIGSYTGGECLFGAVAATGTCQYGPQSLSVFCPPYNYKWANSQEDYLGQSTSALCQAWKDNGGPKVTGAAVVAAKAQPVVGIRHLRNHSFTMMGYARFKYNKGAGEVFEVAGDDDIWIYVDGVLAVDLGGTHLPALGKVDMDFLASHAHGCHSGEPLSTYTGENENCDLERSSLSWKHGSWHHLHFFYAERQSDASNLRIRSTLSTLASASYGAPFVGDVVVQSGKNGKTVNSLFLNIALDPTTVELMQNGGAPSILVLRNVTDAKTGVISTIVYGFVVSKITGSTDMGEEGVVYNFDGVLIDAAGNVVSDGILRGDKIAFNVMYDGALRDDGNDGSFNPSEWDQLISWAQKMPFQVKSITGHAAEGFYSKDDWAEIIE